MAADPLPALRPLGLGDLLDEVFALYRRRFRTFVGISAVVQVPLALVSLPLATTSPGYYYFALLSGRVNERLSPTGELGSVGAALLVLTVVLGLIGSVLELGAVSAATSGYFGGERPSIEAPYRRAISRFWPLFRLFVLIGLTLIGLFLLAILPVVIPPLLCVSFPAIGVAAAYLLVPWSLAPVALALEDRPGAVRALGRGRSLVRGAWWRTFATLVCLGLLVLVLQLSASALAEIAALGLQAVAAPGATTQPTWIAMVASVLNNLESVLLSPLYYIGLALLYFDRRVRAEGYDLALRARALRQAVAPSDAV